mgnify:CR=1 FL=1
MGAADSELSERDTLVLEVPLDPAHRRMDLALREADVPVDDVLASEVTPQAEEALYKLMQSIKYDSE